MIDPTAWLTQPSPEAGIHFAADREGAWTFVPYPDLADSARRVAAGLVQRGVQPGDVVAIALNSAREFITTLFGVWAAGATVAPLAPPLFNAADGYIAKVAAILSHAAPTLAVTGADTLALMTEAAHRAGLARDPWLVDESHPPIPPRAPADIALLQFTSGSTGNPRGVLVTRDNLAANFAAFRWWSGGDYDDAIASWLPLHHDMGLVGGMLFPVTHQSDLWLMRPDQFIRDPARWLECFQPGRARHTFTPTFGLSYAARKVKPDRLAGLDLSGLRSVVIGAETVDAEILEQFAAFAAPARFSPLSFIPAYGLAENTVAVTALPRGRPAHLVRIDWSAVRFGEPVPILRTAVLGEVCASAKQGWLIGHGMPTPEIGISVEIVDDNGPAAAGVLGEIVVGGTSVAAGYHRVAPGGSSAFRDGKLYTGDAGFHHGGDLYVIGRMGSSIKIAGRSVYAEDLDIKVAAATGLARTRIAVVGATELGRPGVVVFGAAPPDRWAAQAYRCLRAEFGAGSDITLISGDSRMIRRTTSGKPRRREMWRLFKDGSLGGTVVSSSDYPDNPQ